jgi:hypothetical protein
MRSSTSSLASRDHHDRLRVLALWTGALAGPVVMLVLLQTNYVLSYVACERKQTWFIHAATVLAALIVAVAGGWAWRAGGGPMAPADAETPPLSEGTSHGRTRWMAYFALTTSIWFVIVILSMLLPVAVLETCQ